MQNSRDEMQGIMNQERILHFKTLRSDDAGHGNKLFFILPFRFLKTKKLF